MGRAPGDQFSPYNIASIISFRSSELQPHDDLSHPTFHIPITGKAPYCQRRVLWRKYKSAPYCEGLVSNLDIANMPSRGITMAPSGTSYGDPSGAIFNMYTTRAQEFDKKNVEHWKEGADTILVFVRSTLL